MKDQFLRVKKGIVPIVVLLVVVAVGALIVVYLLFIKPGKNYEFNYPEIPKRTVEDRQLQDLKSLSSSDEVSDIDADIDNTKLDNLDAELSEVDSVLTGI